MERQTGYKKEDKNKNRLRMPVLLGKYQDFEFSEQIKARIIYYIFIISFITIATTMVINITSVKSHIIFNTSITSIIITKTIVLFALVFLFVLFVRGYYSFTAISLLIILQLLLWILMLANKESISGLYRVFAHIVALNTLLPVLSSNKGRTILYFLISNVLFMLCLALKMADNIFISPNDRFWFIFTALMTLLFISVASYNIFKMNRLSLEHSKEKLEESIAVEAELKHSEKRYRELAELLPQSIFEIKKDGILLYINKAGLQMIGYSKDDLPPDFNFINIIAPEDRELIITNTRNFFITGKNSAHVYSGLRKDGRRFPIRFISSPMVENDEIIGMRGVGIDISEQKEAEAAIRDTLQLFRTIIEFAPLPMLLFNDKMHILMINNAFKQVSGYAYSDITRDDGIRVKNLIPPDALTVIIDMLNTHGSVENFEVRTYKKDSKALDILFYCKKIVIKGKEVYLSTFIDMTEKKRNELELEYYREDLERLVLERTEELAISNDELQSTNDTLNQQRKELEKTLEELKSAEKQLFIADKMASLGMLAAGIAHEINNPLNFIKGGIYGLELFFQDNLPVEKQEEAMPLIVAIDKGIDRAADIVKSLNRFNRQTDNRQEECNLHSIIEDCLILLDNQMKNRITIIKNYNATQYVFYYNQGRINQAIINLLANSAQAIKGEGKIEITTSNKNNSLFLMISDTGGGIDEKHMSHIFNPFFTTKEPGQGTGLGLSITFQIIKEIDGEIEYVSTLGEGTTVTVRIPLIQ